MSSQSGTVRTDRNGSVIDNKNVIESATSVELKGNDPCKAERGSTQASEQPLLQPSPPAEQGHASGSPEGNSVAVQPASSISPPPGQTAPAGGVSGTPSPVALPVHQGFSSGRTAQRVLLALVVVFFMATPLSDADEPHEIPKSSKLTVEQVTVLQGLAGGTVTVNLNMGGQEVTAARTQSELVPPGAGEFERWVEQKERRAFVVIAGGSAILLLTGVFLRLRGRTIPLDPSTTLMGIGGCLAIGGMMCMWSFLVALGSIIFIIGHLLHVIFAVTTPQSTTH